MIKLAFLCAFLPGCLSAETDVEEPASRVTYSPTMTVEFEPQFADGPSQVCHSQAEFCATMEDVEGPCGLTCHYPDFVAEYGEAGECVSFSCSSPCYPSFTLGVCLPAVPSPKVQMQINQPPTPNQER